MIFGRVVRDRLLWLFTAGSLLVAGLRLTVLAVLHPPDGRAMSWDLRARHEELRLLEQHHYPRADILSSEGVVSAANSVYPPNAFPWLWLLSPFGDLRWNQLWHGAWSLAALAVVLRFAWGVGAATSRLGGLACVSGVLAIAANFGTFTAGQYGLIQLVLMLGATLMLYRGRTLGSGVLFGVSMFKPTNAVMMAAMFLRERSWAALAVGASVVAASAIGVGLWSNHWPTALLAATYPQGSMLFTEEGVSLVMLVAALGVSPQLASLVCAVAGFALLLYALRFVDGRRDPLLVLALVGFVTRVSMYHRPYDDGLLSFLFLACLRQWISAPSSRTTAVVLLMAATLQVPSPLVQLAPHGFTLAMVAVWSIAMVCVIIPAPGQSGSPRRC